MVIEMSIPSTSMSGSLQLLCPCHVVHQVLLVDIKRLFGMQTGDIE